MPFALIWTFLRSKFIYEMKIGSTIPPHYAFWLFDITLWDYESQNGNVIMILAIFANIMSP